MTTFVLVHGAFHGAWCWQPLMEHLVAAGHGAVAVDLPIDDERADWRDHVEAVIDVIPDVPRLVVIGHSRAGRLIPLVLEHRAFDAAIYIAASLPHPVDAPARRCDSVPMLIPAQVDLTRDELGRLVCPAERAMAMYYQDCGPELRDWAVARLRPQCDIEYPRPETQPDLPGLYVAGTHDRAVNIQWMRAAATEILGRPAIELPSGHCPFLSATQELADVLKTFASRHSPSSKVPRSS